MKDQKFTAAVLSIGIINILTGKTQYDWSIYQNDRSTVSLTNDSTLLYSSPGTFEIGDSVLLRNNDTNRKVGGPVEIVAIMNCDKESVLSTLKEHGYDYYPLRPFQKRKLNRKLKTSYSIKGVIEGHVAKVY